MDRASRPWSPTARGRPMTVAKGSLQSSTALATSSSRSFTSSLNSSTINLSNGYDPVSRHILPRGWSATAHGPTDVAMTAAKYPTPPPGFAPSPTPMSQPAPSVSSVAHPDKPTRPGRSASNASQRSEPLTRADVGHGQGEWGSGAGSSHSMASPMHASLAASGTAGTPLSASTLGATQFYPSLSHATGSAAETSSSSAASLSSAAIQMAAQQATNTVSEAMQALRRLSVSAAVAHTAPSYPSFVPVLPSSTAPAAASSPASAASAAAGGAAQAVGSVPSTASLLSSLGRGTLASFSSSSQPVHAGHRAFPHGSQMVYSPPPASSVSSRAHEGVVARGRGAELLAEILSPAQAAANDRARAVLQQHGSTADSGLTYPHSMGDDTRTSAAPPAPAVSMDSLAGPGPVGSLGTHSFAPDASSSSSSTRQWGPGARISELSTGEAVQAVLEQAASAIAASPQRLQVQRPLQQQIQQQTIENVTEPPVPAPRRLSLASTPLPSVPSDERTLAAHATHRLQAQVQALTAQLGTARKSIEEVTSQAHAAHSELATVRAQNAAHVSLLERRVSDLSGRLAEAEAQVAEIPGLNQAHARQVKELTNRVEASTMHAREVEINRQHMAEMAQQAEIAAREARNNAAAAVEQAMEARKEAEQLQSRVQTQEQTITQLCEERDEKATEMQAMRIELAGVRASVEEMAARANSLETQQQAQQRAQQELETATRACAVSLSECAAMCGVSSLSLPAHATVQEMQAGNLAHALQTVVQALRESVTKLAEHKATSSSTIKDLQADIRAATEVISHLRHDLSSAQAAKDAAAAGREQAREECAHVKALADERAVQLRDLTSRLDDVNRLHTTVIQERATLAGQVTALQAQVQAVTVQAEDDRAAWEAQALQLNEQMQSQQETALQQLQSLSAVHEEALTALAQEYKTQLLAKERDATSAAEAASQAQGALQALLSSAEARIIALEAEVSKQTTALAAAHETLHEMQADVHAQEEKHMAAVADLQSKHDQHVTGIRAAAAEEKQLAVAAVSQEGVETCARIQTTLHESEGEVHSLRAKVEQLQAQLYRETTSFSEQSEGAQAELHSLRAALEAEKHGRSEEAAAHAEVKAKLEFDLKDTKETLEEMGGALDAARMRRQEWEKRALAAEELARSAQGSIALVKEELKATTDALTERNAQIAQLQSSIASLQEERALLKSRLQSASETLDTVTTRMEVIQQQADQTSKAWEGERDTLHSQVRSLTLELRNLQSDVDSGRTNGETVRALLQAQQAAEGYRTQLDAAMARVQALTKDAAALTASLEAALTARDAAVVSCEEARADAAQAERARGAVEAQLAQVQQELHQQRQWMEGKASALQDNSQQVQMANKQLHGTVTGLQALVQKLQASTVELSAQAQVAQEEARTARESAATTKRSLAEREQALAQEQASHSRAQATLSQQLTYAQGQVMELQAELAATRARADAANAKADSLTTALGRTRGADQSAESHSEDVCALEKQVASLQAALAAESRALEAAQRNAKLAVDALNDLRAQPAPSPTQAQVAQGRTSHLERSLAVANARAREAETDAARLRGQLSTLATSPSLSLSMASTTVQSPVRSPVPVRVAPSKAGVSPSSATALYPSMPGGVYEDVSAAVLAMRKQAVESSNSAVAVANQAEQAGKDASHDAIQQAEASLQAALSSLSRPVRMADRGGSTAGPAGTDLVADPFAHLQEEAQDQEEATSAQKESIASAVLSSMVDSSPTLSRSLLRRVQAQGEGEGAVEREGQDTLSLEELARLTDLLSPEAPQPSHALAQAGPEVLDHIIALGQAGELSNAEVAQLLTAALGLQSPAPAGLPRGALPRQAVSSPSPIPYRGTPAALPAPTPAAALMSSTVRALSFATPAGASDAPVLPQAAAAATSRQARGGSIASNATGSGSPVEAGKAKGRPRPLADGVQAAGILLAAARGGGRTQGAGGGALLSPDSPVRTDPPRLSAQAAYGDDVTALLAIQS